MTTTWENVMVTGHRRMPLAQYRWMDDELLRVIDKLQTGHGMTTAVSGMALCVDMRYAELAKLSGARLHAVTPFPSQPDPWPAEEQDRYHELLRVADEITPVSRKDPDSHRAAARMLHQRNDRMLSICRTGAVIAVWDPTKAKGGTWSAVNKAVQRRLPIIWLNVREQKTTIPTPAAWGRILSTTAE